MPAFGSHLASHSIIIDILSQEDRSTVSWPERLELLEDPEELWSNLREVQSGININYRSLHFRNDSLGNRILDSFTEGHKVLLLQGKSSCIEMATEVFKKVRATFYSIIEVETMDTSRRTSNKSFLRLCKYDCRKPQPDGKPQFLPRLYAKADYIR